MKLGSFRGVNFCHVWHKISWKEPVCTLYTAYTQMQRGEYYNILESNSARSKFELSARSNAKIALQDFGEWIELWSCNMLSFRLFFVHVYGYIFVISAKFLFTCWTNKLRFRHIFALFCLKSTQNEPIWAAHFIVLLSHNLLRVDAVARFGAKLMCTMIFVSAVILVYVIYWERDSN